jgi:hypothetical protein
MATTILKRSPKWLPVKLSRHEIEVLAKEQAQKTIEAARLDEQKKAVVADYTGRIKLLESRVAACAVMVDSEEEYRDVLCREELDERTLTVRVVREDTEEIVSQRTMTVQERQTAFPLEASADA